VQGMLPLSASLRTACQAQAASRALARLEVVPAF